MKLTFKPTPDQQYCIEALSLWAGGAHHLPRVTEWGCGVALSHLGDLSTFDFNRLTSLILIAHRYHIRIEVKNGGPLRIRIIAHRRKAEGSSTKRHPGLEELKTMCDEAAKWPQIEAKP